MIRNSDTWRDVLTLPVLAAIIGSILFFAGTFFDIATIDIFGHVLPIRLEEIGLEKEVMIARAVCLAGIACLFIPKIAKLLFVGSGIALYVMFAPKAFHVMRHLEEAGDFLKATGLSQYIDIYDYLSYSVGFYLIIAGALIILGICIYFLVQLFQGPKEDSRS